MIHDFKKIEKNIYQAKTVPSIVIVPKMKYLAIRGQGDPNEIDGEYQKSIKTLYPVAYTLKMSYKTDYKIPDFFEYVVPPLEGFWWQDNINGVNLNDKASFQWISLIRIPDFIRKEDFEWAVDKVINKKKIDCSKVEYLEIDEGLCVQILHLGPYDKEIVSVELMNQYIETNGYIHDFSNNRHHHEIYLSDPRKVSEEKYKTIIRHPIKKR